MATVRLSELWTEDSLSRCHIYNYLLKPRLACYATHTLRDTKTSAFKVRMNYITMAMVKLTHRHGNGERLPAPSYVSFSMAW